MAEVPELVDCIASGTTHDEALQAVHLEIAAWIESAQDAGHPVPTPLGRPREDGSKKGRGSRRQERNEKRRRQREQGRRQRREST